jgi:hypothetical protein
MYGNGYFRYPTRGYPPPYQMKGYLVDNTNPNNIISLSNIFCIASLIFNILLLNRFHIVILSLIFCLIFITEPIPEAP